MVHVDVEEYNDDLHEKTFWLRRIYSKPKKKLKELKKGSRWN